MNTRIAGTGMFSLLMLGIMLGGCATERKMQPVAVGELEEYRDPGIGFSLKIPKGWIANTEVGRARFYNEQDVNTKFLDPTGVGPLGVEIAVDIIRTPNARDSIQHFKEEQTKIGVVLKPDEPVKHGDLEGVKIPYTANYGGGNIIHGHYVMFPRDSVLFSLAFAGFGDHYEAYAAIFDAVLNSFVPPKPKDPTRDETLPSETYASFDAGMFTFLYPDNFNTTNPSKGRFEQVIELRGIRQDCSIRFDVFPAQGLTVEKVFEQNKGSYRSRGAGEITIGGEKAMFINYSPSPVVDSRAHFLVHNDKVVRITLNWYKPHAEHYTLAYNQVISSIKFK